MKVMGIINRLNSNLNWIPHPIDLEVDEEYISTVRGWDCRMCGKLCLITIDIAVKKPFANLQNIITGIPHPLIRTAIPAYSPLRTDDVSGYFFTDGIATYATFPYATDYIINGIYVAE